MQRPKSDYAIQTVTNALRLVEAFEHDEELGVTELARRLNLHKNNVFRLLATLEQRGYVEQSTGSDRYRLGTSCMRLGCSFTRNHGLVRQARGVLEHLAAATEETAHLGVDREHGVIHLDGVASPRMVGTGVRIGARLPAHCTALGKVLIGCEDGELARYDRDVLAGGALDARTRETIVDRDKLVEHLGGVGRQGWALDLEETEPGLACAAAPVYDATGHVVAALSISAPAFRAARDRMANEVVPTVVEAAQTLSKALGYSA